VIDLVIDRVIALVIDRVIRQNADKKRGGNPPLYRMIYNLLYGGL